MADGRAVRDLMELPAGSILASLARRATALRPALEPRRPAGTTLRPRRIRGPGTELRPRSERRCARNIAPLQRQRLLAADVLASTDLNKAVADRIDWRSDERRWCREGKLPKPGWW